MHFKWKGNFVSHRLTILACVTFVVVTVGSVSLGQKQETPIGPRWWPSEWGPDDQKGALNHITPAKVLQANQLIKQGKIYELGQVYEPGMPLGGSRFYSLTIPGVPTSGPLGANKLVSNDELFSGQIGQVGTQLDGLGHVGVRVGNKDLFYNGFDLADFGDGQGLKKLGVENMGPVFTRGILLDVARVAGVRRLPPDYIITPADLQKALDATGLKNIEPGDVVLLHTGHGDLWMVDNDTYSATEPGIGMAAARWLTDRKISMVGADTWGIEVVPFDGGPDQIAPVHHWNITRHGIYHLENLKLSELAADKVYTFAFIYVPLPLKGATGSPGSPLAVK